MTTQTITLNIQGMTCSGCVKSVTNALNQVAGVQSVDVSLDHNNATINFDDGQVQQSTLKEAIEDAGFDVV